LYPISIDFLDATLPVVRTPNDQDLTLYDLELLELRAIRDADFIVLHAPDGYVGLSGAFEMGYATAYRKPVFSTNCPRDEMLACQTTVIGSLSETLDLLQLTSS
ncbi:MAG TPA: hypothetical protein VLF69_05235, partial [Candidatus Saccharimonadales bacterium]|nr:hypothetical protein [Candidatus Saccharimonadales bacterium]